MIPRAIILILGACLLSAQVTAGQGAPAAAVPAKPKKVVVACDEGGPVYRPPTIRAYWVNRYVDPANRRIMHGKHWLFVAEEDAGWILRPAAVRPAAGSLKQSRAFQSDRAPLQAAELGAELARQKEISARAEANAQRAAAAARELTEAASQITAQAGALGQVPKLAERLTALEKAAAEKAAAEKKK